MERRRKGGASGEKDRAGAEVHLSGRGQSRIEKTISRTNKDAGRGESRDRCKRM